VLTNVQVLTAGTRMEQSQEDTQPTQVTVVTLLVSPEQAERLALASTEGKIQLALRNPLDQGAPETPGIKTAGLLGGKTRAAAPAARVARARKPESKPEVVPVAAPLPSVEIIRGDKRSIEVIK
jgi:pilus assembly protein CpaB